VTPTVAPPFAPMLARLERELPLGDYLHEPKWDGFRCLAFREGAESTSAAATSGRSRGTSRRSSRR
jgi:ATP-dependent DNA ligase